MKSDVGIGVEPMPAGRVTTVHDRDGRIRMPEERVGECHPGGPGADDEIVGVELLVHGYDLSSTGVRRQKERPIPSPS